MAPVKRMLTRIEKRLQSGLWCILGVGLLTGCLAPGKATVQRNAAKNKATWNFTGTWFPNGSRPPLVLNDNNLPPFLAGDVTNGCVRVSYATGIEAQAALLARLADHSLACAQEQTGMTIPSQPHIYLLHLPGEPRRLEYTLSMPRGPTIMPWLMFLTNASAATMAVNYPHDGDLVSDLREAPMSIFLITHELYEINLVNPRNPLAMGDLRMGWGGLRWTYQYHTRWFREGFASYAGYCAEKDSRRQLAQLRADKSSASSAVYFPRPFDQPFSKLAKVKTDLFKWDQDSSATLQEDYYPATLGLFLLIEQRHGSEAIRNVVAALPTLPHPDGKAILRLFQQKIGVNLKTMVKDFTFPDFGLRLKEAGAGTLKIISVQPASPAAQAGLATNDLIREVNGHATAGPFDYEWQVMRAREAGAGLSLGITRDGQNRAILLPRPFPAAMHPDPLFGMPDQHSF
jgi:hypothetical protein